MQVFDAVCVMQVFGPVGVHHMVCSICKHSTMRGGQNVCMHPVAPIMCVNTTYIENITAMTIIVRVRSNNIINNSDSIGIVKCNFSINHTIGVSPLPCGYDQVL